MAANREVVQRRTFAKGFTRNFSVFLDDVVTEPRRDLVDHSAAWPAAFQITIKNNAESSPFELLRDVLSKRFQSSIVCRLNENGQYFFWIVLASLNA
jgi:hypothetical protein